MFRFKDWPVYKDAKHLFRLILKIVSNLPQNYRYSIGDQMIRAGLSVVLNIAEGSGKNSDKELNRFFDISMGSLNETMAIVDILRDIDLITGKDADELVDLCGTISRQLSGFKKKIGIRKVLSSRF